MKKQLSLFVWAATTFGIASLLSNDVSAASRAVPDYAKYEQTGVRAYRSPNGSSYQPGREYVRTTTTTSAPVQTRAGQTVAGPTRRNEFRKYFLAHPFFQPLEGKIGSVTDVSYNTNNFDMTMDLSNPDMDPNYDAFTFDASQISIKEDLSYGITNNFALVGVARYTISDYELDWKHAEKISGDDKSLDMWGLGAQWRFVDSPEWIGMLGGHYQSYTDMANAFYLDAKLGYKVSTSTIYGVGRFWSMNMKYNSYGAGVESGDTTWFVAFERDKKNMMYFEGGLGIFSVLGEDWTLNIEAIYGSYSWYNRANVSAAIGFQPGDWWALNLYARTAVFNSADDQSKEVWYRGWATDTESGEQFLIDPAMYYGNGVMSDWGETSFGLQVIFQF